MARLCAENVIAVIEGREPPAAVVVDDRRSRCVDVSATEFAAPSSRAEQLGALGPDDQRGALHHLTPERVAAAAGLVRDGVSVTLSLPLGHRGRRDNPEPADHHMTMLSDTDIGSGSLRFAKDYVGVDYHNDGHTHIDALCHVAYEGSLYNGRPQRPSTRGRRGGRTRSRSSKDGLVGRGVLLDIPRLRGVPWLEPGEHIFAR